MSEFQASNFTKENGGTPNLVGKTELTSPYFFVPPSGDLDSIEYIQIMTTGNGVDFGDLTSAKKNGFDGMSTSHGGLT